MKFLKSNISIFWLGAFVITAIGTALLPKFGFRLEDVQTIVFPIFLISAQRLPLAKRLRLPNTAFCLVFGFWGFGALNVRGYLPDSVSRGGVFLSRMDGDVSGEKTRNLLWRYNYIAKTYDLPRMVMVERNIKSDELGAKWIDGRSKALMLIRGNPEDLRIVFPPAKRVITEKETLNVDREIIALASGLSLKQGEEIFFVQPDGFPAPLAIVASPDTLRISGGSTEIMRHFLATFAEGFESGGTANNFERRESARDAFFAAGSMSGHWLTNEPRAVSLLLSSTIGMFDWINGSSWEDGLLDCARFELRKAANLITKESAPGTMSSIRNNQAVLQLFDAHAPRDRKNVTLELRKITHLTQDGSPTRGARAALLNLMIIDRMAIF